MILEVPAYWVPDLRVAASGKAWGERQGFAISTGVILGRVPRIHSYRICGERSWIAGTSPTMTTERFAKRWIGTGLGSTFSRHCRT